MQNRKGVYERLRASSYQGPALIPATPWLGADIPASPVVATRRDANGLALKLKSAQGIVQHAIWAKYGDEWRFTTAPATVSEILLPDAAGIAASAAVITAVDRLGNESPRVSPSL